MSAGAFTGVPGLPTPEERRSREERWPDPDRLWKAIMLAPTTTRPLDYAVAVCNALLRRESVPVDELDPEWVARLGERPYD
jgi:hypothetical protein